MSTAASASGLPLLSDDSRISSSRRARTRPAIARRKARRARPPSSCASSRTPAWPPRPRPDRPLGARPRRPAAITSSVAGLIDRRSRRVGRRLPAAVDVAAGQARRSPSGHGQAVSQGASSRISISVGTCRPRPASRASRRCSRLPARSAAQPRAVGDRDEIGREDVDADLRDALLRHVGLDLAVALVVPQQDVTGTCASTAEASSGRVNCRPPSPISATTGRSGAASFAPIAAGSA